MNELKYVLRRFPDCASRIQALAESDAAVGEILADYEELCIWLGSHQNQPTSDPVELDSARALIRDLEKEILSHLKKHGADTEEYDSTG